jgi:hypothetical protein
VGKAAGGRATGGGAEPGRGGWVTIRGGVERGEGRRCVEAGRHKEGRWWPGDGGQQHEAAMSWAEAGQRGDGQRRWKVAAIVV